MIQITPNKICYLPFLQNNRISPATPGSKGVAGSVTSITNLPVELQQKIAFNLAPDDYENLRKASPVFNQNLESIHFLEKKLASGNCKGDYKKDLENLKKPILRK